MVEVPTEDGDMLPTAQAGDFSVLRGCLRHRSPTGLPGPLSVLGRVVVPMQREAAVRAGAPADGQALGDQRSTAATGLRGIRGIDSNDLPTGAYCLEGKYGQECCPARVLDGLGKVAVLNHIGRL